MERTAVGLSFWVGGVGLVALKGAAYAATGSILVRTSMFDSLGDVFSSAIMWVTSAALSSVRNLHLYPVGRARLAPLGVLCFCAFMLSSMCSMALDAIQQLFSSEDDGAAAAEAASRAVRRLAEDYWWMRLVSGRSVDGLVDEYGVAAPGEDAGADTDAGLSTKLMWLCVVVKLLLYFFCKRVTRVQASDIVKALATDHGNDIISNFVVICVMSFVAYMERCGFSGPWLTKLDPAASLVLSLWIVYTWTTQCLEQVKVLSDHRADEDEVDEDAVRKGVQEALEASALELGDLDVYHAGESFRLRLDVRPKDAGACEEKLVAILDRARKAAQTAVGNAGAAAVEVRLRQRPEAGGARPDANDWVREYPGRLGS